MMGFDWNWEFNSPKEHSGSMDDFGMAILLINLMVYQIIRQEYKSLNFCEVLFDYSLCHYGLRPQ